MNTGGEGVLSGVCVSSQEGLGMLWLGAKGVGRATSEGINSVFQTLLEVVCLEHFVID